MKPSLRIAPRGKKVRKRNPIMLFVAEGDNKTEKLYLQNFQGKNGPRIVQAKGNWTDPPKMMKALLKEAQDSGLSVRDGDQAFCIFDSDAQASKQRQIDIACKMQNELVHVIVSSPCFEEWFLCHFRYSTRHLTNAEAFSELESLLPGYRKSDNIFPAIESKLNDAVTNAEKLEKYHIGLGRDPHSITSNPSTEMFKLIKYLLSF